MKPLLIALTLALAAGPAAAKTKAEPKTRAVAQTAPTERDIFARFLACRAVIEAAKDDSWLSCFDGVTVAAKPRRQKFFEFLMMGLNVGAARACTGAELKAAAAFPGATPRALCFDYAGPAGRSRAGAAFFVMADGRPLLLSLFDLP